LQWFNEILRISYKNSKKGKKKLLFQGLKKQCLTTKENVKKEKFLLRAIEY
jgi:hypothetical protein